MIDSRLEFLVLGPLDVRAGGVSLRIGGAKQRALLAMLLAVAGMLTARATLAVVSVEPVDVARGSAGERMRWIALAAVPSGLVIAVTAYLTTDIAAAPWTVVRSNDVNGRVADEQARAMSQAQAYCTEKHANVDVIKIVAARTA